MGVNMTQMNKMCDLSGCYSLEMQMSHSYNSRIQIIRQVWSICSRFYLVPYERNQRRGAMQKYGRHWRAAVLTTHLWRNYMFDSNCIELKHSKNKEQQKSLSIAYAIELKTNIATPLPPRYERADRSSIHRERSSPTTHGQNYRRKWNE